MNYYLCSISFRHELASLEDLMNFAQEKGFAGIELWGVHAEAISGGSDPKRIIHTLDQLQDKGLHVSMISHYVNLLATNHQLPDVIARWRRLIALAKLFRTNRIRIFAGNQPSHTASPEEWSLCAARLRMFSEIAYEAEVWTVIEFHPHTYFDTLQSVHSLLLEANHPGIRVNVDFLHVWESGCDPIDALSVIKPWIGYYHLKNVRDREQLSLFEPDNVYSPNGIRDGLVSLAEGALDYARIIRYLLKEKLNYPAALEWFGDRPFHRLESDVAWLMQLAGQPDTNVIVSH
ncbi:sugar phosphate isomerase/epimerase family protein [Paenibacillus hexagrammi]|uniref:Sugar phosphate isomerase/epimerase n=1 Tax=Paenibacillus hexagrammi TaxID=2908839 RepID=A0ABY3SEK2_9BACL|nr:sugar phosphate isomerase/epimerase [Paenibacillus sp. YPD9-1]UJF31865.1 sugar phosphate isomerase/epimerase [Paenibacillus sp. YPD9-1]